MKVKLTRDATIGARNIAAGTTVDVDIESAVELCGNGRAVALDPAALRSEYHRHLAAEHTRAERRYGSFGTGRWCNPVTR